MQAVANRFRRRIVGRLKSEIRNPETEIGAPLIFEPIFQERIWGGRKLAELYGKKLPPDKRIGESWEIVDRSEAQSIVQNGPLKGKTLHELWTAHRREIFGESPRWAGVTRFPLLIKLLDARDKLSLQVHPPKDVADKLGGEPKTECWYVAAADPKAELFVGFSEPTSRSQFAACIEDGTAADCLHAIPVNSGDVMFLPSGRFHAIGAGCLLVEVQQNSDTTYRVFDWNRLDDSGKPRDLHIDQALESINYDDIAPKLIEPEGELLIRNEVFEIQKWNLDNAREVTPPGRFAIVCCLSGKLSCSDLEFGPGEFFLLPACARDRQLKSRAKKTTLLRVTIPDN